MSDTKLFGFILIAPSLFLAVAFMAYSIRAIIRDERARNARRSRRSFR